MNSSDTEFQNAKLVPFWRSRGWSKSGRWCSSRRQHRGISNPREFKRYSAICYRSGWVSAPYRPSTVTDPLSNVTQYQYDGVGNLTNTLDAMSNHFAMFYDSN